MKLIIHIFIVVIFLCCSGCMTGLVIESATKGEIKPDKIRFNRAYWRDDNLIFHIDGSLAEGENKRYTIKQEKEWAADARSDYYTIRRSGISPGHYLPPADWVEISILKSATEDWDPPVNGPKCYLVQDCNYGECKPTIKYHCPNKEPVKSIV